MLLLLIQLFSTLAMFGVIWFVQVVHYPLFAFVGEPGFRTYASLHATRTTWVVAPLMLLELGSACLLLFRGLRPSAIPAVQAWAGAVLVGVIWLSTALVQVPLNDRLQLAYSPAEVHRLVTTNWVRTAAWTLRAALTVRWCYACMTQPGAAARVLQ